MKTKDFIRILKEADPSGEAHIRMKGGIPEFAILKAGYYDGPYNYIDHQGNWVHTASGMKVDIYCTDILDFVWKKVNIHVDNNWDEIRSKFKFDLDQYCSQEQRDERSNEILSEVKEAYDDAYAMKKSSYDMYLKEMVENALNGWTWFQNKKVDENIKPNMHIYYTWIIYDADGVSQGSSPAHTESIQKSGLWEKIDNNVKKGYYQWVFKK